MKMERWTARPMANETPKDQARAGLLLRRAVVTQPLDAITLADIRSRLPDERHPAPRRLVLRFALALALFLSGGGVVMSATVLGHWSPFGAAPAKSPPTAAAATPAAIHRQPPTPPPAEAVAEPPPLTPAPSPELPRRARARAQRSAGIGEGAAAAPEAALAPPEAAAAPGPSAIAEEAALVGAALRKLREQDDAAGALALLDAHDARFAATGALADEASTTRVEALLRLGRHASALALLDARDLRPTGRGRELLATRCELRADAGRCPAAVADFDALLADDAAADDIAERALYGRAACRARMGETNAARADLTAYLARFPAGRLRARARAALDR